jgi:Uma2 family endonuclease
MSSSATEPRRHRLTVADYYRMGEVGILAPDARVELIDGEIIDMAPPGSLHAATVHRLLAILARNAGEDATLLIQNPVRLSQLSEPQPDLALLRRREDYYAAEHPRATDVLLVIEVADSSLRFDREAKVPLYARYAIPEVWLVDLRDKQLVRYRNPQQGAYMLVDRPDLGMPLGVAALPELRLDLRSLFG